MVTGIESFKEWFEGNESQYEGHWGQAPMSSTQGQLKIGC